MYIQITMICIILYHFRRVNKMIGGLYYIILSISKVYLPWLGAL